MKVEGDIDFLVVEDDNSEEFSKKMCHYLEMGYMIQNSFHVENKLYVAYLVKNDSIGIQVGRMIRDIREETSSEEDLT